MIFFCAEELSPGNPRKGPKRSWQNSTHSCLNFRVHVKKGPKTSFSYSSQAVCGSTVVRPYSSHECGTNHAVSRSKTLESCTDVVWVITQLGINEVFHLPCYCFRGSEWMVSSPGESGPPENGEDEFKVEREHFDLRKLRNDL